MGRSFWLRAAPAARPAPQDRILLPMRPPGALADEALFAATCVRCLSCSAACPRQLIAADADGRPVMTFDELGCNECGDCQRACPSGALSLPAGAPDARAGDAAGHCAAGRAADCRLCGAPCGRMDRDREPQPA